MRISVLFIWLLLSPACSKDKPAEDAATDIAPARVRRDALVGGPFPTLLLAKAQFSYQLDALGRRKAVPGAAKLVLERKTDTGWHETVVEDSDTNVFHKAMPFSLDPKGPGILTISGTAAALKLWRWQDDRWIADTLWQPTFGGKWDRLRDVEVGDVTGDGQPDIVVATHDQGVVAVLQRRGEEWVPEEIDRSANTFVHEIEIGDVDGDGRNEIFATPSKPNSATLASQPGSIVMYRWSGERFARSVIAAFPQTHAKEILVADLEGSGHPLLWAAVEAQTEMRGRSLVTVRPVEIREYRWSSSGWHDRTIATLPDTQCRVLVTGDLDHDGKADVVATGMRSGVWWLRRGDDGDWTLTSIDHQSSGYEHAALICDLAGTGHDDLFVASDEQGELRRYRWNGAGFDREVIAPLPTTDITFAIACGRF